jgi:hypothetical protein
MRRVNWLLSLLGAGALIALSAPMLSALPEGELPAGYYATVVVNGQMVPTNSWHRHRGGSCWVGGL